MLVVEIAVEFIAVTCETALVQIVPDGCHQMDEVDIAEMVVDDESQVFIDAEDGHSIQVWQHVVGHAVLLTLGEGVVIQGFDVTLLEPFHRNE